MKRFPLLVLAATLSFRAYAGPPVSICDDSTCAAVGVTAALPPIGATRFTCGLAGLAATLTECQALAAARVYYITDIVVGTTTSTSGTYGIQYGTGTNCATGTATLFPAPPATTSSRYQAPIAANPVAVVNLTTPLAVPAGNAICVIGAATNTINVQISGYYR